MEMKLSDGRYVPDGLGGFEAVTGMEETLARVLFCLTAHRGAFPLMPELGSRLYLLGQYKPSARAAAARQFVSEALAGETAASVVNVEVSDIGDGRILVTVTLDCSGTAGSVSLEI